MVKQGLQILHGVIIGDGCGLRSIETNLIRLSCHVLYKLLFLNSCTQATKQSTSVRKVGMVGIGVCVSKCLKEQLAQATDKWLCVISNIRNS